MKRCSNQSRIYTASVDSASTHAKGPKGSQVIIALLVLGIATLGFLVLQYSNTLQLQRAQSSTSASNTADQLSEAQKILNLQKSRVLANHTSVDWPGPGLTMPLTTTCECFRYSGYLSVSWNSTVTIKFEITQFQLDHGTPSGATGDYKLSVSSGDALQMRFVFDYCPSNGCGTLTYTLVYHY